MSRTKNGKAAATMKTVLFNLQLQQYLPAFQRHNIDLKTFVTMNEQTLQSIGVLNETHRKILIMCIRKLSQLLITTAATNSIEELDEHLLAPIIEEQNEISSGDVGHQSPDFIILDEKSDKSPQIIPDPPPAYTVEPQEMSVLSQITSLTSNNVKSNNHLFSKRLSLSIRSGGGTNEDEDSHRRHSMPTLPSYSDVVRGQKSKMPVNPINLGEKECDEELPSYSCTVDRAGYLTKKDESKANGQKANDRSWRKFYVHLWGTFVRIYKSEPLDINHVSPVLQFSMDKAIVGLALDYTKRRNVFRIYLPTGHTYLFQTMNRTDCVSWIEKLQSSANISSTIDDREMPMFITLPIRRRRRATMPQTSSTASPERSSNRDQGLFVTVTSSGLTYEYFNEIARELQQVQVTGALPQRQLLW